MEEFVAALSTEKDFCNLFPKSCTKNSGDLLETFQGINSHQKLNFVWESLLRITVDACTNFTSQLHLSQSSHYEGTVFHHVIKCAETSLLIEDIDIPESLYQTVLALHGFVLTVEDTSLRNEVCMLCENWWHKKFEGCYNLISTPLIYLLDNCLRKKPATKFVRRLWKMFEALSSTDEGQEQIWNKALNLYTNFNLLQSVHAQKLLAQILAEKVNLIKRIYSIIKYQLPQANPNITEIYASIMISAWQKSSSTTQEVIEEQLQDLMHCAVHIHRGGPKSLHANLMKFLEVIHSKKPEAKFNDVLVRLYQPFLWRSLKAANSGVRANAAQIFFDVFPLINLTKSKQDCENELQRHFDILFELLVDEDCEVRTIAATGCCRTLSLYWEQIPLEVITDILNVLFRKLGWDQSSSCVRVAVVKGVTALLDCHYAYSSLNSMVPKIAGLFHDRSEKVRSEFLTLLLKLKHIKAFQVWQIVDREHVLARLEVDSPRICVKIVQLIYRSFIDDNISSRIQLQRCIDLINSGLVRARRFYRYAVKLITAQQAVKCMLLLRKCLVTCVNNNRTDKENLVPQTNSFTKITRKSHMSSTSMIRGSFTLIDNELTEFSMKNDNDVDDISEELSIKKTSLMQGMVDVICILWTGFKKELNMTGNDELLTILHDKFERALPEFLATFTDEGIQTSLVCLASFLPSFKPSTVQKDVLKKLSMVSTRPISDTECSYIITYLVRSGQGKKLLHILLDWLDPSISLMTQCNVLEESDCCKLKSFCHVVSCLLSYATELETLTTQFPTKLRIIIEKLGCIQLYIQNICEKVILENTTQEYTDILCDLYRLHSRLILFCDQDVTTHISKTCSFVIESCVKHLHLPTRSDPLVQSDTSTAENDVSLNPAKRPRRLIHLDNTSFSSSQSVKQLRSNSSLLLEPLANGIIKTALQIVTSYIRFYDIHSDNFLHIEKLMSATQLIHCQGSGLIEVLEQFSLVVCMKKDPNIERVFISCFRGFFRNWLSCGNKIELSSKLKTLWVNFLNSIDLQSQYVQTEVCHVILESFLSTIGQDEMTPSINEIVTLTLLGTNCCKTLVLDFIDQMSKSHEEPSDGFKLIVKLCYRCEPDLYGGVYQRVWSGEELAVP